MVKISKGSYYSLSLSIVSVALIAGFLLILVPRVSFAADPTYNWTRAIGGTGADIGYSIAADSSGDVYIAGDFNGSDVDFDATSGTDLHSSNGVRDIFVTKYLSDGSYGWTRTFGGAGGDGAKGVTTDSSGNVYVTGQYNGSNIDFDGTGGSDLHSSAGGDDIFITKYASDGSYGWTRTFGGISTEVGNGIVTNSSGNVYITGSFNSSDLDFDGTAGTDLHSSNGSSDMFITKYASDGSYGWTRTVGGTGSDLGNAIAVDSSGNVIATGGFSGSNVDLDGTAGSDLFSSNGGLDAFITTYTTDGDYGWTRTFGGTGVDQGLGITTDSSGNVYTTGQFAGSDVDFDGTAGSDLFSSSGGSIDIFTTKYTSDGSYGWTRAIGGTNSDAGLGIRLDSTGNNVYVAGRFRTSDVDFDFDPTAGTDLRSSNGEIDIFFSKYGTDGSYRWTRTIGGAGDDRGESIAVDDSNNILISGRFSDSNVDFDATGGSDLFSSAGSTDIYFTSYADPPVVPSAPQESSSSGSADTPVSITATQTTGSSNTVTLSTTSAHFLASVVDHDQVRSVYIRISGQGAFPLRSLNGTSTYSINLSFLPVGSYAYALTADYGRTTSTEYGTIVMENPFQPPLLSQGFFPYINELFRTAYERTPTFMEWEYWAKRVETEDKNSLPALLGAMQWQQLFGMDGNK